MRLRRCSPWTRLLWYLNWRPGGVKDPGKLLNPPPVAGWEEAGRLLADLGALDSQGAITRVGREMVLLPLHPRLSHLLIRSFELGCPRLGADLAALLSERDILRPQAPRTGRQTSKGSELSERLDLLRDWRKGKQVLPAADPFALQAVDS
jgi:ATP-dependent helicase HrpB